MIRGRWFLAAAAVAAWFVVLAGWIGRDPRLSEAAYDEFSTYNTSGRGVSQAFGYFGSTHGLSRRLMREISIERPPDNATIFRIGFPGQPRWEKVEEKKDEKKSDEKKKAADKKKPETKQIESLIDASEEAWIRRGGHLVVAPTVETAQIRIDDSRCSDFRQVFPIDPPLPAVDVPRCHSLSGPGLQRFHSLLNNDTGPVLVRRKLGDGEILVFSMPEALTNEFLARGSNLAMLERLAGAGRPVYFDETMHGIELESSLWDLLAGEWRLGPAFVVLALAALGAFWRKARATGLPERGEADVRSESVDLVQSLGQLYDRAVDREESLRLYYQGLVRAVHARTGLKGEALERLVRSRTEGYDAKPRYHDISREEFQRMLKILNHAYETVGYANTR